MNGFIKHIIERHINTGNTIAPRLPSKFETPNVPATFSANENFDTVEMAKPAKEASDENNHQPFNPTGTNHQVNAPEQINKNHLPNTERVVSYNNLPLQLENDYTAKDNISAHEGIVQKVGSTVPSAADWFKPPFQQNDVVEHKADGDFAANKFLQQNQPDNNAASQAFDGGKIFDANFNRYNKADNISDGIAKTNDPSPTLSYNNHTQAKERPIVPSLIITTGKVVAATPPKLYEPTQQIMAPTIKVSIGRIEVRAITTASPVKMSRAPLEKPRLSLDDYLNKRNSE